MKVGPSERRELRHPEVQVHENSKLGRREFLLGHSVCNIVEILGSVHRLMPKLSGDLAPMWHAPFSIPATAPLR